MIRAGPLPSRRARRAGASRGEPRHNYVCCQQSSGSVYFGSGGDQCRCAGDAMTAKAAETRAAYVAQARAEERKKAEEQIR